MPSTDIKTLAAVAEIAAAVGVIVSLVFVVISLNQNTAALQSINDNLLYEFQDSRLDNVTSVPGFAEVLLKHTNGEKLSEAEALKLDYWMLRELNMWELAYIRYREGLMPPAQWVAWEASFTNRLLSYLDQAKWNTWKDSYGMDFRDHVDEAYAEKH